MIMQKSILRGLKIILKFNKKPNQMVGLKILATLRNVDALRNQFTGHSKGMMDTILIAQNQIFPGHIMKNFAKSVLNYFAAFNETKFRFSRKLPYEWTDDSLSKHPAMLSC